MSHISKEEGSIINQMFSWCASENELKIIIKSISDIKKEKGLYNEVVKLKGDLQSLSIAIAEATGLNLKASGELGRQLWFIVKAKNDRARQMALGITHGTWLYFDFSCKYPEHSKLNNKKISLTKGAKIGMFKWVHPGEQVGCCCFLKVMLPF
ncbi:hypothetical protein ACOGYR_001690 [Edwardsiella piscicida]|uniref:hypothetical protein n=1 Tax=Edwardsiella piscicida TaxID=1263550 RepID=UPI00101AC10F|nr:hypothetical protein [Edwardsiella piscicida]QBB13917.1 hypothetical protein EVK84_15920 [Edwardsiella piscicida]